METKTTRRIAWIADHRDEIVAARGNKTRDLAVGWGWWARALSAAGIDCDAGIVWSGSLPTTSTGINLGIARYIRDNAPESIL